MSEDWNTKYGTRRVRRDPPTLDEAIFCRDRKSPTISRRRPEIAAALMGVPFDSVLAEVKKQGRINARATTRVIAGEQGRAAFGRGRTARGGGSSRSTSAPERKPPFAIINPAAAAPGARGLRTRSRGFRA